MSDIAIKVENLNKKYILRHQQQERYVALRDVVANVAKSLGRRVLSPFSDSKPFALSPTREEFFALKDVFFEIKQGDRLGIIGRNGAGKTTLLKILSRITEPTSGRIEITGRVASLLEVGTGFHPELTGRENIFLNGAILGMGKGEIKKKFDEIVDFAEVEKFLDTPVKHYSSGMYLRLAFAVAAHLEPDILVVDEVLAVGDAQFQKKCLGKMEEVGKEGRTVLFVSHNMNAIEQLCDKVLLIDKGRKIKYDQDVRHIIMEYLFNQDTDIISTEWVNSDDSFNNIWFKPLHFFIGDERGNSVEMPLRNDADVWLYIEAEIKEIDPALNIGYAVYTEEGNTLYWSCHTDVSEDKWPLMTQGLCTLSSRIPKSFFNEGLYRIELIGSLHYREWLFEPGINAPSIYLQIQGGLSESPYWMEKRPGILAPVIEWSSSKLIEE